MQFEIAEAADYEYNMVTKVSKDALARLGKQSIHEYRPFRSYSD